MPIVPMYKKNCAGNLCKNFVGTKGAKGFCPKHYRNFKKTGNYSFSVLPMVCIGCSVTFNPRNSITLRCDPCKVFRKREAYAEWLLRNPNYHKDYSALWQKANPGRSAAYSKIYKQLNREAVAATYKAWEAKNPNHAADWINRGDNRENSREAVRRRRARLRSVPTFVVTDRDIRRMLERFRNCCAYCSAILDSSYHVDHVVPVSMGGSNGIGNLAPACAHCNLSKSNWFLSEWKYRGRLSKYLSRRKPTHLRSDPVLL